MDIDELLTRFSLTKQEAHIYMSLLTEGDLTGYEAAKLTGISRSNVYNALAGLVDKGAACAMEGAVTRYAPMPLDEFCGNCIRQMEQYKADLLRRTPERKKETDGYITIKGRRQIIHKMKNIIEAAAERVYVAVPGTVLEMIHTELQGAIRRGIKVVAITDGGLDLDGATIYRAVQPEHQIRLIADSASVITGDIADGESSTCLFSMKKNLIDLIKDALKNEIRLIEYRKGNNQ